MTDYEYDEIMETIENLAIMVHREFLTMREEIGREFIVVREESAKEFAGVRGEIKEMRDEMRAMRNEMMAGFAAINGIVFNHEFRLDRLEKKTDIS